ncbi:MAG: hypothetical protein R2726_01610 [Acidimicrobiales bacterium]
MADDVNAEVERVRTKVRDYLTGVFDAVDVDEAGECALSYGSARVSVSVRIFDEDSTAVHVEAPLVTGATASPELFHYVATSADTYDFGHLGVREEGDGKATITFSHSLLGDFLDDAELRTAVVAVSFYGDQLDDELAARFGGRVYDAGGNGAGDA